MTLVYVNNCNMSNISITTEKGRIIHICTLSDQQSLDFWNVDIEGRKRVVLTDANLLAAGNRIKLELEGKEEFSLSFFPDAEGMHVVTGRR